MKRRLVLCLLTLFLISVLSTPAFVTEQVTNAEILDMGTRAANFIDQSGYVPQFVYTDAGQTTYVSAAEFMCMMAKWLRFYENNDRAPNYVTIVRNINGPPNPDGIESGIIYQEELLSTGTDVANFIEANNRLPNYMTVYGDGYTPESIYGVFAMALRFFAQNDRLPNYSTVYPVDPPEQWDYQYSPPDPYPWSKNIYVPYYSQPDSYTCGPTSLRMVMEYYGVLRTVSQISNYCAGIGDSPYYDGVGPATLVSAGKYYGFSATTQRYGWNELKSAIQYNHPVIGHLQIYAGGSPRRYPDNTPLYSSFTGGHYVVVRGLQADANGNVLYVVINDPSKGSNIKITGSSFDYAWAVKSRRIIKLQ